MVEPRSYDFYKIDLKIKIKIDVFKKKIFCEDLLYIYMLVLKPDK